MRAHVLVGVALLVAGCGDDAGGTAPTPDPPAAPVSIDLTDSQADGILTIDGVDHRFFVDSCVDDPPPEEVAGLLLDLDFEMLGRATIDGRAVTINAFRFDLAGRSQDAYGYFYETRPEEGSTFVKVENEPGLGELLAFDGTVWSAGPAPFQRRVGIVDEQRVDLGPGSIVFTCPVG